MVPRNGKIANEIVAGQVTTSVRVHMHKTKQEENLQEAIPKAGAGEKSIAGLHTSQDGIVCLRQTNEE